jgi:hypothetical protein
MVCGACGKTVPDESAFCLSCGARLAPATKIAPVNGGGAPVPVTVPLPDQGAVRPGAGARAGGRPPALPLAAGPAAAGTKQAFALSFRPIPDERLRYRVARWVCDRAPAHALTEVQEGLTRGGFFTFLALTADEVETTRQGILGLGLAPAQITLAPATTADFLRPTGAAAARAAQPKRGMRGKEWVTLGIAVVMLFLFGLVVMRLFGGRGF